MDYTSVGLGNSVVTFVGKRKNAAFRPSLYSYVLVMYVFPVSEHYVVKFPFFCNSVRISSRPEAFLFLIFVSITLIASCINCPSLMSRWLLMIFVIGSSVTLVDFLSRLLKCSFRMYIRSSWLTAFSFVLAVFFLLLTSFIVRQTIRDGLSSTEFLILFLWSWKYFVWSLYALVDSLCAFLSFWALALVRFLLLHSDGVFMSSCFP